MEADPSHPREEGLVEQAEWVVREVRADLGEDPSQSGGGDRRLDAARTFWLVRNLKDEVGRRRLYVMLLCMGDSNVGASMIRPAWWTVLVAAIAVAAVVVLPSIVRILCAVVVVWMRRWTEGTVRWIIGPRHECSANVAVSKDKKVIGRE